MQIYGKFQEFSRKNKLVLLGLVSYFMTPVVLPQSFHPKNKDGPWMRGCAGRSYFSTGVAFKPRKPTRKKMDTIISGLWLLNIDIYNSYIL